MVCVCGGVRFRERVGKGAGRARLSWGPTPAPRNEDLGGGRGTNTQLCPGQPLSPTMLPPPPALTLEARAWPSDAEKLPFSLERLWLERLGAGEMVYTRLGTLESPRSFLAFPIG